MSIASKLFGIWAMSRTVSTTTPLFIRLLAGMAAVAFFVMVAAAIIVILIFGSVWLAYGQLRGYGVDSQASALIIGGFLLALLGVIMQAAQRHYCRLTITSQNILQINPPGGGRVSRTFAAFMNGLNASRRHH